ncbi:MAG TPA: tetratricopeptide repeat protein [Gemmatimonadota bacterium]|nr:tetratricopeptide repeat protein [Gemmatimonadota bacterium]
MRRRIRVFPIPLFLLVIPIVLPHPGPLLAQPSRAADSLYRAGEFAAAGEAYEALARAHPDSGRIWYRLGSSLYETGRHGPAVEALQRATATFRPASYAHYLLAQVYAESGQPADAVAEIRRTVEAQGIPYAVLISTEAFAPLRGVAEYDSYMDSINPCGAPEYSQFDFWIGEWNVMTSNGGVGGLSSIEREYNGCLIVESWAGPTGVPAGTSQNFYDKATGRWRQNWIDGQASNPLWLVGGLDASGAMVMMDSDASANPLNRITWTPNPDGTVRQHWETSTDGGATWSTSFDGLYVPRERAAGG